MGGEAIGAQSKRAWHGARRSLDGPFALFSQNCVRRRSWTSRRTRGPHFGEITSKSNLCKENSAPSDTCERTCALRPSVSHALTPQLSAEAAALRGKCGSIGARLMGGPLQIGDVFLGKYAIRALIGRGAFACVYHAVHSFTGRHVAIKVLYRQGGVSREVLKRGQAEAQIMSALRHQNITEVLDADRTKDGLLYIVMELLEGRNLRDVLNDVRSLAVEEVLQLGAQLAEGAYAAHIAGAIHRDLKPENVFITAGNGLKILDFGVVKLNDTAAWSTQKGIAHGTVIYMSPEQIHLQKLGPASDIYAVGIILYEALIGQHPVRMMIESPNLTVWEVAAITAKKVPPRLDELDPRIPREVATLVAKALERNPEKRYANMKEFARAMLRCRAAWLEFARNNAIPLQKRDLSQTLASGATQSGSPSSHDTDTISRPMFLGALSSGGIAPGASSPERFRVPVPSQRSVEVSVGPTAAPSQRTPPQKAEGPRPNTGRMLATAKAPPSAVSSSTSAGLVGGQRFSRRWSEGAVLKAAFASSVVLGLTIVGLASAVYLRKQASANAAASEITITPVLAAHSARTEPAVEALQPPAPPPPLASSSAVEPRTAPAAASASTIAAVPTAKPAADQQRRRPERKREDQEARQRKAPTPAGNQLWIE
jgi:serine/threonine protein kinase